MPDKGNYFLKQLTLCVLQNILINFLQITQKLFNFSIQKIP
jgi:hypothetical protein